MYKNLIDEDDIIIEEESREGVSHNTFSNNTGCDMQKIMRLIKQTSSNT